MVGLKVREEGAMTQPSSSDEAVLEAGGNEPSRADVDGPFHVDDQDFCHLCPNQGKSTCTSHSCFHFH